MAPTVTPRRPWRRHGGITRPVRPTQRHTTPLRQETYQQGGNIRTSLVSVKTYQPIEADRILSKMASIVAKINISVLLSTENASSGVKYPIE